MSGNELSLSLRLHSGLPTSLRYSEPSAIAQFSACFFAMKFRTSVNGDWEE
jgi:hypothetical protein